MKYFNRRWFADPEFGGYPNGAAPLAALMGLLEETENMTLTRRYASNLLRKGTNNEFTIVNLTRQYHAVEGLTIGFYYSIDVGGGNYPTKTAVGVTPLQAVERCLEKHGVTFR